MATGETGQFRGDAFDNLSDEDSVWRGGDTETEDDENLQKADNSDDEVKEQEGEILQIISQLQSLVESFAKLSDDKTCFADYLLLSASWKMWWEEDCAAEEEEDKCEVWVENEEDSTSAAQKDSV